MPMPKPPKKNPTKQRAGRLGGLATYTRHGSEHMSRIGTAGARSTWSRYSLTPYGQTQYAMVRRDNNKIIRIIGYAEPLERILQE
jgi:hypothetical protein